MAGKPQPRQSVVQPLDQSYRIIALTRGHVSLVDLGKYEDAMCFIWHTSVDKKNGNLYAVTNIILPDGRRSRMRLHRFVMGLGYGDPREIDHRDPSQTLDNRISNLRMANQDQQARNKRLYRSNTSGYKGVVWKERLKKWQASISVSGKRVYLGIYLTKEAAHAAYCEAAHRLHGEFARIK